MGKRAILGVSVLVMVTIVVVVITWLGPADTPLRIEYVGLTNVPTTGLTNQEWMASDATGDISSSLSAASPSHARFKISNHTRQAIDYRFLLYDFADADPRRSDMGVHRGMRFGPAPSDVWFHQVLNPGETKIVTLPRPPFECVWRANVACLPPLTVPQNLLHSIRKRVGRGDPEHVVSDSKGRAAYAKVLSSIWITNQHRLTIGPANGSHRSSEETNRTSSAAGSRR